MKAEPEALSALDCHQWYTIGARAHTRLHLHTHTHTYARTHTQPTND